MSDKKKPAQQYVMVKCSAEIKKKQKELRAKGIMLSPYIRKYIEKLHKEKCK